MTPGTAAGLCPYAKVTSRLVGTRKARLGSCFPKTPGLSSWAGQSLCLQSPLENFPPLLGKEATPRAVCLCCLILAAAQVLNTTVGSHVCFSFTFLGGVKMLQSS